MDVGIYNQGKLGGCTANAAAAYEFDEIKQNENNLFIPIIYIYNEREVEQVYQLTQVLK